MMRGIILWSALLFSQRGITQVSHLQSASGYLTTGAYGTKYLDAFSFTSNPACLGSIRAFLSGCLGERKWMLKELDNYALTMALPALNGGLGIAFQRSGDADYNEQTIQLAYGRNLGRLEMGINFTYLRSHAAGYHGLNFGSSGIGARFHVSEKLITGWEIVIPLLLNKSKMNPETAPELIRMGFGYEPAPEVIVALQIEKSSGLPLDVIPSIGYCYDEQYLFSFGINSDSGALFFKTGWRNSRLCIQLYTVYEPLLGFTPGLVLLWEGKNRKG